MGVIKNKKDRPKCLSSLYGSRTLSKRLSIVLIEGGELKALLE